MHRQKGFTFIELMVALVIMAILIRIAMSSYNSYILQNRRSDGINALLSVSLAEEQYRTSNTTYGTLSQVSGSTTSPQGYYSLTASNITATSYTITATGVGTQANDTANGTACSPLVLSLSNGTISQTPTVCWPS